MTSHPSHVARAAIAIGLRTLVLATAAGILAGCYSHGGAYHQAVLESIPNDYRQRHPIVLKEAPRHVELFIGNRRGTLNAAQRAEVLAFAQHWHSEGTGGVMIDVPSGTPNARSAATALQEVRAILAGAGVPPHAVATRPNRASDPRKLATLRLHYPKLTADVGPCGLWPYDLGPTYDREHFENREYYNLGCATQRNLAAMVDNPTDLVQPRAETPIDAQRRAGVLEKYQKGEATATKYPEAGKGRISEVGQ
jgi:pilus assembly protein CpaD